MEEIIVNGLLAQYKANRDTATTLALNTVSNIEIPVCNTLSSLPKQNIIKLLHTLGQKLKYMSSSTEKSLILTLFTDVLTSMIKNNEFYESFEGNNTSIINMLCKKIKQITRDRMDELKTVQSHFNQMIKYTDRIPEYPELKDCLSTIQWNSFRQNFPTVNQQLVPCNNVSNVLIKQLIFKDTNENILKENNTPNCLKRTHLEANTKTESINTYFECKPIAKNENKLNHIKLPEIKPKTDQNNKLPQTKPINAFNLLMSSAKKKYKKIKL